MNIISFDALRTLHLPNVRYIKPESMYDHLDDIKQADWLLFPQYWQLNALVHGLKKRIFPSLASYMIGHDKIEMTRTFRVVTPQHHPYTIIAANTPYEADKIWDTLCLPFVAKIPKSSMGNGVFLIETIGQWRDYLEKTDVLYAQEYLPIDRDIRVIWVGNKIVNGYWRLQSDNGFHNNISQGGQVEIGLIPKEAQDLVTYLAQSLDINHAGFDIAMVGATPYVIEINRIFGNQGIASIQSDVNTELLNYLNEQQLLSTAPINDQPIGF
ncbi:Ribosomal protein S6 modification protein [Marinomonas spartinae]|uniref:Ribosomal protein S6 modification protein n=1 Tax=Marinomonas spartinae TaxID=1792290 RepID=A0A1A8T312_9GAMM|nr:alpha-L-glutamate ligase [Marinomonas spartinae]SBS26174.1 Ribosomal protein S6 modification protein [Marinomonas spartinae]